MMTATIFNEEIEEKLHLHLEQQGDGGEEFRWYHEEEEIVGAFGATPGESVQALCDTYASPSWELELDEAAEAALRSHVIGRGGHAPDCPCPPCCHSRRKTPALKTLSVKIPPDLHDWIKSQGGSSWVREQLEKLRDA